MFSERFMPRPGTWQRTSLLCFVFVSSAVLAQTYMVIPRKNFDPNSGALQPSVFPHWTHRVRYRCDSCHMRLFEMELGASEISMELMTDGKSCATCHDGEAAFAVGIDTCNRCHKDLAE